MTEQEQNLFTCARCGQTYVKAVSDEEALQESEELFGNYDDNDLCVVCDECFNEFMGWLSHA